MKTLAIVLVLFTPLLSFSQFFSGSYISEPALGNIDLVKIDHSTESKGKYAGTLSIQGFLGSAEIWDQEITPIKGKQAKKVIGKYGEGLEILSVHQVKLNIDNEEWNCYLLGHLDEGANGNYIVVRQKFDGTKKSKLTGTEHYYWVKADRFETRSAFALGAR
jgi:hypothetical protein